MGVKTFRLDLKDKDSKVKPCTLYKSQEKGVLDCLSSGSQVWQCLRSVWSGAGTRRRWEGRLGLNACRGRQHSVRSKR